MNESIRSLRWNWILLGWFVAVALTSLFILVLAAFDVIGSVESQAAGPWIALSLLVAFYVAGLFVGSRVLASPVLHGTAIGLFSLLAWLILNLIVGEPVGETTWRSLDASTTAMLLVTQAAAAILGARSGVCLMLRASSRET